MQAIATPQKVPVTTDPPPQATLDDTLLIEDETPEPVHTSKSPEQAADSAEPSQGFDKTQQTPKTRAYLACMQRKSTDDLSLLEHPTAEAAPAVVTHAPVLAPAPAAPAATPTPVAPTHVLTETPVTAAAPAAPAATPTVAPTHVLTGTPVTAPIAPAAAPTPVAPVTAAVFAPAAAPTPVVESAPVLTPTPEAAIPVAPSAPATPLEPEPQSPDPRLLQFWSRFKRSPESREPLVHPLPEPMLNLPASTESLYTVLDPLQWRHLIRSNVGTRSDWRSCFVVAAYNHNTIFRFANERGEIEGTPQLSDFPLVVCKGALPTQPIAVAAPHLAPATAATTAGMPDPAPLATTPQAAPASATAVATPDAASAAASPSVASAEVGSTSPMPPSPAVVGTPASHPAPPVTPPQAAALTPQQPTPSQAVQSQPPATTPQPTVPPPSLPPPTPNVAENSADNRAQYMKFHRSVKHPKAPKEVTQKFHEASGDKVKMRALFQEFQRCNGDWLSSTLVIRESQTTTNTQGGKDGYLSKADP